MAPPPPFMPLVALEPVQVSVSFELSAIIGAILMRFSVCVSLSLSPLAAAPLLYHNEPNIPGSPHHSSTLPSHSPAPSTAYAPYQQPPPGPPGSTPYTPYQAYSNDPRQSYVPPPGSAAGYSTHSGGAGYIGSGGGGGDAHAYPPNTTGTNPFNTPYSTPGAGGPHQGPPPGAAGPGGYTGHAEVY
jgi:hypothetical protein